MCFMQLYIHACTHAHIHACARYILTFFLNLSLAARSSSSQSIYTYTQKHICMCKNAYACIHACTHAHIHTHILSKSFTRCSVIKLAYSQKCICMCKNAHACIHACTLTFFPNLSLAARSSNSQTPFL